MNQSTQKEYERDLAELEKNSFSNFMKHEKKKEAKRKPRFASDEEEEFYFKYTIHVSVGNLTEEHRQELKNFIANNPCNSLHKLLKY